MRTISIASLVEGDGEVSSVPILVRRDAPERADPRRNNMCSTRADHLADIKKQNGAATLR